MSGTDPVWISEADVVALMDLREAIDALEDGLKREAAGTARDMAKTHVAWGDGDSLHAIGAAFEGAGFAGTKTWAHTHGGVTPLLLMWDAADGHLVAVIEAFALGQMRTGALSGVATRWMAAEGADSMALFGTGKQALTQLAAVAAVRPLKRVCIYGRDAARRGAFVDKVKGQGFAFAVDATDDIAKAARDAQIVTLATRAREPFFFSRHAAPHAHINAIGAITLEREEFGQDLFPRVGVVVADDPGTARRLSKELRDHFGADEAGWATVKRLSALVAAGQGRPAGCDLSLFKGMGMGIFDLALGIRIVERAVAGGRGRVLEAPRKVAPRLR